MKRRVLAGRVAREFIPVFSEANEGFENSWKLEGHLVNELRYRSPKIGSDDLLPETKRSSRSLLKHNIVKVSVYDLFYYFTGYWDLKSTIQRTRTRAFE